MSAALQLRFDLLDAPTAPAIAAAAEPEPTHFLGLAYHVGAEGVALGLPDGRRAALCTRAQWDALVYPVLRRGFAHSWIMDVLGDHGFRAEVTRLHTLTMAAWGAGVTS